MATNHNWDSFDLKSLLDPRSTDPTPRVVRFSQRKQRNCNSCACNNKNVPSVYSDWLVMTFLGIFAHSVNY